MKTYLKDSMQLMPKMMDMQSMYKMMMSMHQMMCMQYMYQMMSMQSMYPMMNMQGMNPMMNMQEVRFPIPMLAKLEQLSPTQIQISYDRDVDVIKGMKPTNYWIMDTMNVIPQGIATLGRNDSVNAGNSLTDSKVKIDSKNGSAKTFILTFNRAIPSGAEYMLIICYVTVKGAPPYSGDNGKATFIGK